MMLGEEEPFVEATFEPEADQGITEPPFLKQLVVDPDRQGGREARVPARREGKVRVE